MDDARAEGDVVATRRRTDPVGVAVIGAGKIGRHRARLAAQHAAVDFLAIADLDAERAEELAIEVGADHWSTDADAVINHPDVTSVIVSTQERAHTEPIRVGTVVSMGSSCAGHA